MKAGKVLIVDDNEITRFITEQTLQDMELAKEIIITTDGKEAIDLIEKGLVPDLILLDLNMPGMGGFAFLETYQSLPHTASLPPNIIVITTSTRREDRDNANKFDSVIGYAEKPVTEQKIRLLLKLVNWEGNLKS